MSNNINTHIVFGSDSATSNTRPNNSETNIESAGDMLVASSYRAADHKSYVQSHNSLLVNPNYQIRYHDECLKTLSHYKKIDTKGSTKQASCVVITPDVTIPIDDPHFVDEVLLSDVPVLVDFWADWCGPCKQLSPALEQLARDNADSLKVYKVNVDEFPGTAELYGINKLPTLLLFQDRRVIDYTVGSASKEVLQEFIDRALKPKTEYY